jgi:hypothetical protein
VINGTAMIYVSLGFFKEPLAFIYYYYYYYYYYVIKLLFFCLSSLPPREIKIRTGFSS